MAADDSSLLTQFQNRMMFGAAQSEQPSQPPSLLQQQQQQQQLPPLYSSLSPPPPPHGIILSGRHSHSRAATPPFLEQTLPRPHSHSRSLSQPSSFFHSLSDIAASFQPPLGNSAVANQTKVEEGNRSSPAPMMPPPHLVDVSMSDDQDLPVVPANHYASSASSSALPPLSPMSSHHQAASRRHADLLHPVSSARLAPPAPSRGHRRSRSETPPFRFDAGAFGFQEPPSSTAPVSIHQTFFASSSSFASSPAVGDADERRGAEKEVPISQVSEISMKKETPWTVAAMDTTEHLGSAAIGSLIGEADADLFSACFDIGGRNDAFASLQHILRTGKTTSNTDDERITSGADDRDKVSSEHGESFLDMASDSDKEDSDKEGDDGSSYNLKMMDGRMTRHSRSASVDDIVAPRFLQREAGGGRGGDDIASELTSGTTEEPRRRQQTRHHHSLSMDGGSSSSFNLLTNLSSELRLDAGDMKKTMTSDRLAELALVDPKRAKRILANRQSAARSKERKMRYISELERKVQTLQTEATTLSAQLTLMQRDSTGLFNENNELKLKLRSMEQQAQLREALNEALRGEVERLKLATAAGHGQMMLPANAMAPQQFYIHHQAAPTASNGPHPSPAQQQVQQQHGNLPYPPPPSTLHSQQHLQQR